MNTKNNTKQKIKPTLIITLILTLYLPHSLPAMPPDHNPHTPIHHHLNVSLDPENQFLSASDTITLPLPTSMKTEQLTEQKEIRFRLHRNLTITSTSPGIRVKPVTDDSNPTQIFNLYSLNFTNTLPKNDEHTFTIAYQGRIHHPLTQQGGDYSRGSTGTPGIIDTRGVYLAATSYWVPQFDDTLVSFKMETSTPPPWLVVSEGNRLHHEVADNARITVWECNHPIKEIHLVAAPFTEYNLDGKPEKGKPGNEPIKVMAFLRTPDQTLADKYLQTTGQYLELYEKIIGPYPFTKFALVENFWESGYGMPSFTLMGPQIIRYPFILHSSYPHEFLHNWWGNSVYTDPRSGNWSEGLTVMMADHLIKEQKGDGPQYRKNQLRDYTHYAAGKPGEFPLSRFKGRYDSLSAAVGYGKGMMVFHMLQVQLGENPFNQGLRRFYQDNRFKRAGFKDIQRAFENTSGQNLDDFFRQWVEGTGGPVIRLADVKTEKINTDKRNTGYVLRFSLQQTQPGPPYKLRIPVAVELESQSENQPNRVVKYLDLTQPRQTYEPVFQHQPVTLHVDPGFDVFRILHPNEIPPTLSGAFSAPRVLVLLPSNAPPELLRAYWKTAAAWAADRSGNIKIRMDQQFDSLPSDSTIWVMGRENTHAQTLHQITTLYENPGKPANDGEITGNITDTISLGNQTLSTREHTVVAAVRNRENPDHVMVFLSVHHAAALPGLTRKLPHYGRYSFLAFEGDEPANTLKGEWSSLDSPLRVHIAK